MATVLVADDEPTIRHVLRTFLESEGFAVVTAADGVEALEAYQHNGERIDAVVLDLGMPRMSGRACLEALRDLAPELPVIISTGSSTEQDTEDLTLQGASAVLEKPFRLDLLGDALREVLNR